MITTTSDRVDRVDRHPSDDEMNAEFHALLRDAAEAREGRERVHSAADFAAARQESDDLLALARGGARNRPPGR